MTKIKSKFLSGSFSEKSTFQLIFILAAIILLMLPFFTTFNEFLTRIMEKIGLYMIIQNYIVPYETRLIGVILMPFSIDFIARPDGAIVNGIYLEFTWNCIGWQSLILLIVTLIVGLQGPYKISSKIEVILLGLLGTFFVNLLRISFVTILGAYWGALFAIVFHDYFSTFVVICWLFFFWWFSYSYVLEQK